MTNAHNRRPSGQLIFDGRILSIFSLPLHYCSSFYLHPVACFLIPSLHWPAFPPSRALQATQLSQNLPHTNHKAFDALPFVHLANPSDVASDGTLYSLPDV